ncbi:protein kinase, partial [Rhizobiaceae sp. 2RAB30]
MHEAIDGETPVVVKMLGAAANSADPVGKNRFAREIALGVGGRHPGLAKVHAYGRNWIAFELLEPPGDRLSKPGGLRRLVAQLAATLAYLHARGVVHRDVKPAHVMFREEQPVLIDLGVAGLIADDPLEGKEMVGSPAWMAPEQILGAKPAPSADIWSLCAVGASIAKGAPLFHGTTDAVLKERRGTVRT